MAFAALAARDAAIHGVTADVLLVVTVVRTNGPMAPVPPVISNVPIAGLTRPVASVEQSAHIAILQAFVRFAVIKK